MSKMKKRRLSWKASSSSQVVGYKFYWSEGGGVNYDSKYAVLGNVTQIVLPDDVDTFTPGSGPVEFGITAIDELGNESDMVTLMAPYQFSVPKAPKGLQMKTLEQSDNADFSKEKSAASKPIKPPESDRAVRLLKTG